MILKTWNQISSNILAKIRFKSVTVKVYKFIILVPLFYSLSLHLSFFVIFFMFLPFVKKIYLSINSLNTTSFLNFTLIFFYVKDLSLGATILKGKSSHSVCPLTNLSSSLWRPSASLSELVPLNNWCWGDFFLRPQAQGHKPKLGVKRFVPSPKRPRKPSPVPKGPHLPIHWMTWPEALDSYELGIGPWTGRWVVTLRTREAILMNEGRKHSILTRLNSKATPKNHAALNALTRRLGRINYLTQRVTPH